MTAKASIDLRVLAAVSLCASTEKTRYYLNGVKLEIAPRHMTYVATDGHRLAAHRVELGQDVESNTLLGDFIVPAAQCKAIKFAKNGDATAVISGDATRLSIEYNGSAILFAPIDGTFPDWRRVTPRGTPSGKVAHFNPKYLLDFAKVGELLGYDKQPWVAHNGGDPTAVTWTDNTSTIAVITPIRGPRASDYSTPAWIDASTTPAAKAA